MHSFEVTTRVEHGCDGARVLRRSVAPALFDVFWMTGRKKKKKKNLENTSKPTAEVLKSERSPRKICLRCVNHY